MNQQLIRLVNRQAHDPAPALSGHHRQQDCRCAISDRQPAELCDCRCNDCLQRVPDDEAVNVDYVYDHDRNLRALQITTAAGGPLIVMNVSTDRTGYVQGFWGGDFHHAIMSNPERVKAIYQHLEQHHPFR